MSWLTGGLGLSLLLAIASVHNNWQGSTDTRENINPEEIDLNTEGLDLNSIMEMASNYLGNDGVEQILNGDFSKLEEVGKKFLGGSNGELINNVLNALPEGYLGRKLEDMKRDIKTEEV